MGTAAHQSSVIVYEVKDFIIDNFLFGEDSGLTDDLPFLENGIIDSMGFLELIDHVEARYKIHIEDDELIPENMNSLNNIATFIQRKIEKNAKPALK